MTPVARQWLIYPEGTPQRELQDAVLKRYPEAWGDFFAAVANADGLKLRPKSASGTFYAFLRGDRPLPEGQRSVYKRLLKVNDVLLDRIRPQWNRAPEPDLRARLESVARAAVTTEEVRLMVEPVMEGLERHTAAIQFLAIGKTQEALRVLSGEDAP